MNPREIILLPKQTEFLESTDLSVCYVGGLGSGKTFSLALDLLYRSFKYSGAQRAMFALSKQQLTQVLVRQLIALLEMFGVRYNWVGGQVSILYVYANNKITELHGFTEGNYMRSSGYEFASIHTDELALFKNPEPFRFSKQRLRQKGFGPLVMRASTTPVGYDPVVYDLHYDPETKLDGHSLIRASTRENFHLDDSYIPMLKDQFDDKLQAQQIDGDFLDVTSGTVYYAFDENCVRELIPQERLMLKNVPYVLACDFNIDPMCWSICKIMNNSIYVLTGLKIKDCNTQMITDRVKIQYGTCHAVVDRSGGYRKTSATRTDIQIMERAGFKVTPSSTTLHRTDGFNCVNNLMSKKQIIFVKSGTRDIVKELRKLTHDSDDDHFSDGLRYLATTYFPIMTANKIRGKNMGLIIP